jgi:hypothetical protein
VDGLQQGDYIPELMVIEKHPDFGKEELDIKSGVIFGRAVSQNDLSRDESACTFMVRVVSPALLRKPASE